MKIRIDGHADDRGSDEYNLALSQRRAAEAKRFLTQQGIDAARLETVGHGEEQPLDRGAGEAAWAMNRRADFPGVGGRALPALNFGGLQNRMREGDRGPAVVPFILSIPAPPWGVPRPGTARRARSAHGE